MEFKDFQNLNSDDLAHEMEKLTKELHGLMQRAKTRTLKAVHKPAAVRRAIAQIKTILHTRTNAK
jgi:ribosomal protein L29